MLEKLGTPGYETISRPNPNAVAVIQALFAACVTAPVVAEIGVGIGATSLTMACALNGRGVLHLYDFQDAVAELTEDLEVAGFGNVVGFGNTDRHWDSYNWTLGKCLIAGEAALYDYVYIDGAHTFAADALAFVLVDRLLKPGGYIEFDDWNWTFAASRWMQDTRGAFMTDEQVRTPQVKMVLDLFLRGNPNYAEQQPNRLYRKMGASAAAGSDDETVCWRGQSFQVIRHPAVRAAIQEFCSGFETGTLEFFDAVLPCCDSMIDVGAHVGLMSLYAASRVHSVHSFEPSPGIFELLSRNIAANPGLGERIHLCRCGLSNADGNGVLYQKGSNDSGSSLFEVVERNGPVSGRPEASIELRNADAALREAGVSDRTLLKIDIEGAEYLVLPSIAALLEKTRPFLHVSFHPFNLVSGGSAYSDALLRLRCAVQVAEALAAYGFIYCHSDAGWQLIGRNDRMAFLQDYLLRPKPLPRIASPQYGFVDALGFADVALPGLAA